MDPAKLKVVELRAELGKRGLDTKGNKPVLVERLRAVLEEEKADPKKAPAAESKTSSIAGSDSEDEGEQIKPSLRTPSRSSRHGSREPTTPAKTPTRSSSRSSSRLSPAKSMPIETHEVVLTLEPIKEESSITPKKSKIEAKDIEPSAAEEKVPSDIVDAKEKSPVPIKHEVTPKKVEPEKHSSPLKETAQKCEISPKKHENFEKTTPKKSELSPLKVNPKESEIKESPQKIDQSPKKIAVEIVETSPTKSAEISPKKVIPQKSEVKDSPQKTIQSPKNVASDNAQSSPAKATPQASLPMKVQSDAIVECVRAEQKQEEVVKSIAVELSENKSQLKNVDSPQKNTSSSEEKTEEATENQNEPEKIDSPTKRSEGQDTSNYQDTKQNVPEMMEDDDEDDKDVLEVEEKMELEDESSEIQDNEENKHKGEREKHENDRKRKRSRSPKDESVHSTPIAKPENEPNLDESCVKLSWYDSDLHLIIDKENFTSAKPMEGDGFSYMWAGTRATYGFSKDKVFYEAKLVDNLQVHAQGIEDAHFLRLGWSALETSLQLGEEKLSYCFESSGKKLTCNEFSDYGQSFGKDDIVGCYLDFTTSDNIILTYTVNGENLGNAFVISKEDLGDKSLFPHILSKNCAFEVNFGQEDPWFKDPLEGYAYVGKVDVDEREQGPLRPSKREECEVLLLCGLPGSGKSTWSDKQVAENPDKKYVLLGTDYIVRRMTVDGASIKEKFQGKWENILDKATRALNKLLEIAPSRRHNYIIEQHGNIYTSCQKRRMRNFYGFNRKGVVVLPSDEEYKNRLTKYKETNEVRDSSILEKKAGFAIPTKGDSFENVEWVELDEEEGKKVIETYNTEGKTAGFGQNTHHHKKSRFEDHKNRDRRSGYNDRNRNSSWRGGQSNWRDRRSVGSMRHSGPYLPSGSWRGRGLNSPIRGPDRRLGQGDRRSGADRSRPNVWNPSGYQGSQSGVWNQGGWHGQNWSGQQSVWSQGQWSGGTWKGYGQSSYNSNQGGYGNGGWNQQYYSQQYWNQPSGHTNSNQATASISNNNSNSKNEYGYHTAEWYNNHNQSYGYKTVKNGAVYQHEQK